jgi:hypothetical protein
MLSLLGIPLLLLRLTAHTTIASATPNTTAATIAAAARVIHQFPKGAWLENIAVRSNGRILVVRYDVPEVWEIDPSASPASGRLVHRFPDASACSGLAETAPDRFAVLVGSAKKVLTMPKTWAVHEIDVAASPAKVRTVTGEVPKAGMLNGVTLLNPNAVLASDTTKGVIWRVDLRTGRSEIVLGETGKDKRQNPVLGIGVNGVRYQNGFVWVSNTIKGGMTMIPVDAQTGRDTGAPVTFAKKLLLTDDFAVARDGNSVFACSHWQNGLIRLALNSGETVVAGGKGTGVMLGPTSAVWGRGPGKESTLYVSTMGKSLLPMLKTPPDGKPEGGRVVAVTL